MITLVFADALQPFLPPARRGGAWSLAAPPDASLKHVIEARGVPHTEVGTILLNGQPAGFADLHAAHALRHWPAPEATRFVADAHLGRMGLMLDGA